MSKNRSLVLVVVVSAVTGLALSRVAGAVVDALPSHRPALATGAVVPPAPPGSVAVSASNAGFGASPSATPREDGEPDDAHGTAPPTENPYEEPSPGRGAAVLRQVVPSRDGMLRLPGARFSMGSSNQRAPANERPVRTTAVTPFWIDRTEVAVGAYRACVEAGACQRPARASATCTYDAGDLALPVSCVHWADADAYCRFAGKRLPTEREWEFAARGTYAVPFPWGVGSSCQYAVTLLSDQSGKSCSSRPSRAGAHAAGASVFGVQDMSGNVEEWTADWYAESLGPGPAPRAGSAHVLRGGGWLSPPSMSRTTSRNWGSALEAGPNVGFRCARDGE